MNQTPNIGLSIPPTGSQEWDVPLDFNFNLLDAILGGDNPLPGLAWPPAPAFGIGPPTSIVPTPALEGMQYFDTSSSPYTVYVVHNSAWVASGSAGAPITVVFNIGFGLTGTAVCPYVGAPRAGTLGRCVVITKTSDGSTDLTFQVTKNGTNIFTTSSVIPHGTAAGIVTTFTDFNSTPFNVLRDDVFNVNILTGTSNWAVTIQLE